MLLLTCMLWLHIFSDFQLTNLRFAPISIFTGIYGMNVSQISGSDSNPDIWQFVVAVAVMNVGMVFALAISNWIHTRVKHGRKAGMREVFGFAVGSLSTGSR